MTKEKIESNTDSSDKNNDKFLSEVYAKYYETEEIEYLHIDLNYGMDNSSILICFISILIGFLFISISASIFLKCEK